MTTTTSDILIRVEGLPAPVPVGEIVWLSYAPCGCLDGASSTNLHGGDKYTSGEEAFMRDSPVVYRKYIAELGYTYAPCTWQQYLDVHSDRMGKCEHTPKWGVPPLPKPDGYRWMTLDSYGSRRTNRKHLVRPTKEGDARSYARHQTSALCGPKGRFTDNPIDMGDTVPCTKCVRVARGIETAESTA